MDDQNKRAFFLLFGVPLTIRIVIFLVQSSGLLQAGVLESEGDRIIGEDTVQLGKIYFYTSMDAVLIEAEESRKPVFVYVDSNYCSWCKKFEAESFNDERIVESLNNNFETLAVNTARQPAIASSLNIRGTPTAIFLRLDGSEMNEMRLFGYVDSDTFLNRLDAVVSAN